MWLRQLTLYICSHMGWYLGNKNSRNAPTAFLEFLACGLYRHLTDVILNIIILKLYDNRLVLWFTPALGFVSVDLCFSRPQSTQYTSFKSFSWWQQTTLHKLKVGFVSAYLTKMLMTPDWLKSQNKLVVMSCHFFRVREKISLVIDLRAFWVLPSINVVSWIDKFLWSNSTHEN